MKQFELIRKLTSHISSNLNRNISSLNSSEKPQPDNQPASPRFVPQKKKEVKRKKNFEEELLNGAVQIDSKSGTIITSFSHNENVNIVQRIKAIKNEVEEDSDKYPILKKIKGPSNKIEVISSLVNIMN
jgi:hypothetical protein